MCRPAGWALILASGLGGAWGTPARAQVPTATITSNRTPKRPGR